MQAKLIVVGGKASKREVLLELPSTIGRSREADLTVAHPMVSRKHCQAYAVDGLVMIRDLGSLNGTYVAGKRIREAPLPPNREFIVGPLTFQVRYEYSGSLENLPPVVLDGQTATSPKSEPGEAGPAEAALAEARQPAPTEPAPAAAADDIDFEVEESQSAAEQVEFKPDDSPEPSSAPPVDDVDFDVDESPTPLEDVEFEIEEAQGATEQVEFKPDDSPEAPTAAADDEIGFQVDEPPAPADDADLEIAEATSPVEEMEFEVDEEPVEEDLTDFEVTEEPISIDELMFEVDEGSPPDEKRKNTPPSDQPGDSGPSLADFLEDLE